MKGGQQVADWFSSNGKCEKPLSRIPVWLVSTTIDEGLRRGMPIERALEGLPVTIDQLRHPRTLIEWDTLMTFTERMIEYGSTLQDTADVFANSWQHPGLGRGGRAALDEQEDELREGRAAE